MPALGELNAIYQNKDVLNTALGKIGGTKLSSDIHWSSSEYSSYNAWRQFFNYGDVYCTSKFNNRNDVRPVLAF